MVEDDGKVKFRVPSVDSETMYEEAYYANSSGFRFMNRPSRAHLPLPVSGHGTLLRPRPSRVSHSLHFPLWATSMVALADFQYGTRPNRHVGKTRYSIYLFHPPQRYSLLECACTTHLPIERPRDDCTDPVGKSSYQSFPLVFTSCLIRSLDLSVIGRSIAIRDSELSGGTCQVRSRDPQGGFPGDMDVGIS